MTTRILSCLRRTLSVAKDARTEAFIVQGMSGRAPVERNEGARGAVLMSRLDASSGSPVCLAVCPHARLKVEFSRLQYFRQSKNCQQ